VRTYRLAFLTDKSYADAFGNDDELVFAEKTSLINRVNEVYNDDLAVKFVMVAGTDTLLNLNTVAEQNGAHGPCGAHACFKAAQPATCSGQTLDRNRFVLGQLIGAENYDIGHIGLGKNGGGIAGLGVVGGPFKADGCTGLPDPTGDVYAIDYVAHELGHQMGADHTFNGPESPNCSFGRNNTPFTSQVEPGSGSSIMGYAGICRQENLQSHTDPYFSFASVDQINATTAEAPVNDSEEQVVNFSGLDPGESITISCSTGCTPQTVTFTDSAADAATFGAAVTAATGAAATVTGYDGHAAPNADGFTVDWVGTQDIAALTAEPDGDADFTSFTGTIYNGGPIDNRGLVAPTTNHSPVVTAPADKTIPTRTPFTLTGSATDPDGDPLTYLWEQADPGGETGTGLVDNNKVDGPLFRQFGTAADVSSDDALLYHSPGQNLAGTSPSRTFPDLAQVLAGNTNAETGTCPAAPPPPPSGSGTNVPEETIDCYSEFLPTDSWVGNPAASPGVMHFRLTARDQFTPDGGGDLAGGLSSDEVALTVASDAGPFLVSSHPTPGEVASGVDTVTWEVNGTDAPALAPNVRISLSTDGGRTFPILLADSTPNDGSQAVVLPDVTTDEARLRIEAVGNYFFDINDSDFEIASSADQTPLVDAGPDATVMVGAPYSGVGSFSDEWPGSATATVNYGDGAGPQPLTLTGTTFALQHTYSTPGTKTVTVAVSDGSLTGTDTVTVTVQPGPPPPPASSTVAALAKPKKVTHGRGFKVKATVSSTGGLPAGVVQVYLGSKLFGTGTLSNGKVKITISKKKVRKLQLGKNTLTAKYLGSASVTPSQVDFVVKRVKKKS
jgi:hypothetical protein